MSGGVSAKYLMPANAASTVGVPIPSSPSIGRIGRYELRSRLGRGAMGVVYRAYDTVLERTVALKTHHPSIGANDRTKDRFAAEVRTSSRLNHPSIVTVYDGGIETEVPFIAMELIDGTTLQTVLAERGRLDAREALEVLVPVGEALAYAHRQGVIHRDVKPANIFLAANGQPKIGDFGVAKALGAASATTTMVGTPSHMAPEQVSGKTIDPRVDVFALGVVAYETLTGVTPFRGESLTQVAMAVVSAEPTPPSEVEPSLPRAVDGVIARALAKDPGRRYADTDEFVHDLRDALVGGEDSLERGGARPWAGATRIVGAGVAAAAVCALAWSGFVQPQRTSRETARMQRFPATEAPRSAAELGAADAVVETKPAPASDAQAGLAPLDRLEKPKQAPRRSPPESSARPADRARAGGPLPQIASLARSTLTIESVPPGAAVRVDGEERGPAPVELTGLDGGSYDVSVAFPGVEPRSRIVNVAAGGSRHTITFRLSR